MFGIEIIRSSEMQDLRESISIITRELEDQGWTRVGDSQEAGRMSREDIMRAVRLSRLYYYRNPIAGQWVNLTNSFVFGEGIPKPRAEEPVIQEIIDAFWVDPDNANVLTSVDAQLKLGAKHIYEGNLFFAMFTDSEGNVRLRVFDTEEIQDVICDPEDRNQEDRSGARTGHQGSRHRRVTPQLRPHSSAGTRALSWSVSPRRSAGRRRTRAAPSEPCGCGSSHPVPGWRRPPGRSRHRRR